MAILRRVVSLLVLATCLTTGLAGAEPQPKPAVTFPFKAGDRVAWMGSSSTAIGQYTQTLEFLLQTRHPELKLVFARYTNPSKGTFVTCFDSLPKWLPEFKPTLAFFQFGGNDSLAGENGLPDLKVNMEKCLNRVQEAGGRVLFVTPQGVDPQRMGKEKTDIFNAYAEKIVEIGQENGWTVLDTHHPLEALLIAGQKDDPKFTITTDKSHMTLPAYVAWGYYEYRLLNPCVAESAAELTAQGQVTASQRCRIADVKAEDSRLSFTRSDEILPILPPVAPPPRKHVPVEAYSRYMLKVTGLATGRHEVRVNDRLIGTADAQALAAGVNLNTLLLDAKQAAPWEALAKEVWDGCRRNVGRPSETYKQIGQTSWRFEVIRKAP